VLSIEVLAHGRDLAVAQADPEVVLLPVDGRAQNVQARFLIGADGRQSIVRKQLGLDLHEYAARTVAAGLLVRQATDNPAQPSVAGTFGDAFYLAFPRADGVARLYVMLSIAERQRFAGQDGAQRLLQSFSRYGSPYSAQLAAAQPIGPCATYAMNDSLVQMPLAENAVLIGDAAGWNDPIIGQGISIALRDVRLVAEILLADRSDWSKPRFASYVSERTERMRRLRIAAAVATDIRCTFSEAGRRRREAWFATSIKQPWSAATALAPIIGPEATPAEGYTPEAIERILAMQH
jgi:2-polyprenyl-6-methoxyphenol hydroxylase-like FAD-dependent oxidoreductase